MFVSHRFFAMPCYTCNNRTALTGHGDTNLEDREFVTSGYFGSVPGDATGKLRVVTNNDASKTGVGTTMFFIGTQVRPYTSTIILYTVSDLRASSARSYTAH